MASSVARDVMVVGTDVAIVWADGHESYFEGEALRRACTCAGCKGEQHLFGRASLPVIKPLRPEAFVPVQVQRVGNYGLKVTWGDGHDHGIYTLADLRAACPCEACRRDAAITETRSS
jgi:DUF971 family protein